MRAPGLALAVGCAPADSSQPTASLPNQPENAAEDGDEPGGAGSTGSGSGGTSTMGADDPGSGSAQPPRVVDGSSSGPADTTTTTGGVGEASDEDFPPGFEPVEIEAPHGAVPFTYGPGQAWADVDGDGWLDLFVVGGDLPSRLLRNQGDGTFAQWGVFDVEPYLATVGAAFADYDNDGWPDLYLLRVGPNVLLHNEAGLGFSDVSAVSGTDEPSSGVGAAWGDYDGDGDLDLYVGNLWGDPDALFRNDGDGTFSSMSAYVAPSPMHQALGVAWLDYDDDADMDLYVVNDKDVGNRLWRNDGAGCAGWCFVDVAQQNGASVPACGMGIAVGDYDLDGDLDLSYSDDDEHHLLRSSIAQGQDQFVDVAFEAGADLTGGEHEGWATLFFDADKDGWLDLYVANSRDPNHLLVNRGDGTFEDASESCECADEGPSYGASYADYDHDGAVDLVVGNRGVGHRLFRNLDTNPARHWLTVALSGGGGINRDAVGARVLVTTTGGRVLVQEVKSGSSFASMNTTRLYFGLGLESIAEVLIRWPNGVYEKPEVPALDQVWHHSYSG